MLRVNNSDYLVFNEIKVYNRNTIEAETIYHDIFLRKDYDIDLRKHSPKIIDCGAHIGLATLYFKQKYPDARITSIEANPETLKLLKKYCSKSFKKCSYYLGSTI